MAGATIAEIRKQYPEYHDLSDEQLARGVHAKYYADLDFGDFANRIGLKAQPTAPSDVAPERQDFVQAAPKAKNFLDAVGNAFTGKGQKQEGVGEIAYQDVPDPTPGKGLDQIAAQTKVGLGFFLDPNPEHRARIIKTNIPTAQFRRDEYGNLQVRYNEKTPWAYLNKPGASVEDAQTAANEIFKYLALSKVPFFSATKAEPLLTATARAGAQGAASTALGQQAATAVGGPGVDVGDVAMSGGASMVGNVGGQVVGKVAQAAPKIIGDTMNAVSDRLPGGAQRIAERTATLQAAQDSAERLAAAHAETIVRAAAQQRRLEGEALQSAINEAQDNAVNTVRRQFQAPKACTPARELDRLAQSFGVRLAKSQTEGDQAGMQFMYEAAGGMHGPGAQRAATAFLQAQNEALPHAIRGIAGDIGVTSPQAAISSARTGLERVHDAAKAEENAAWDAYGQVVGKGRTYQKGVTTVLSNMQQTLADSKVFLDLPEMAEAYPGAARVLKLAGSMAKADPGTVPLRDVDRVLSLKRFIDSQWEGAGSDAERRVLTKLGGDARAWLKNASNEGGVLTRRAPVTAEKLRAALALSEQNAKTFRENALMQQILDRRNPLTDDEIARRLFGGGEGGLSFSSNSTGALSAMKQALGPSSPEWEGLRQGALQRLTRGLDDAVATNQTPAILTTFKRIEEAFRRNREAMNILFTPDELARLREAQRIVAAMAPTPRNPANPSNSGIVMGRAAKGILSMLSSAARNVPGANAVAGGIADLNAAARVNVETGGAASPGFNIAKQLADLWNVEPAAGTTGRALAMGHAAATRDDRN